MGNANRAVIEGFEGNLTLPLIQDKLNWVNNFTYMHKTKIKIQVTRFLSCRNIP